MTFESEPTSVSLFVDESETEVGSDSNVFAKDKMAEPTKKEIAAVFKKLRHQGANKVAVAFVILL